MKKICIVTTHHISYNPRVLKEADALHGRGYTVSVVTVNNHCDQNRFDKELMQTRKWRLVTVDFRKDVPAERRYWLFLSLQQKLFTVLSGFTFRFGIAERAAQRGFNALKKLAVGQKADFYIAHHAEALAIASQAADANGVGFGFDAEDFHTGMNESSQPSKSEALIAYLEKKYLPWCKHFTAASKGIGEAYARKYGVPFNTTILNVFPKENIRVKGVHQPVRFYWYSQVIGPNRSLETLLEAAARIQAPFELHLRGSFHSAEYRAELESLSTRLNLRERLFFHPPILAENIIKDAAQFDIGLALESDISFNRNICVTNKIFSYLMSGLAIVGTDTNGQKDIFDQFSDAVCICRKNDAGDLARAMQHFLSHPELLAAAKQAARKAAEERFNWETEAKVLLDDFERNLNATPRRKSLQNSKADYGR